ncbi:glycoside hydrolase family 5 protein [Fibrobacter sp.]|uniref:glycoside hydrolase family 5 protein n=1 Tax=Fibrobacter sp. TaxID=35828 RepID=UPI00388F6B7A
MKLYGLFGIACGMTMLASTAAFAALPKATALVEPMGMGYNIGNTMEVPENPTNWGNPLPNAAYIKAIKNAGFNTVRIPCAWYSHSDALAKDIAANGGTADNSTYKHVGKASDFTNPTIDAAWLKQVKDVVDLIIAEGMYVVLNSHWDEGWLEDRVFDGTANPRSGAGDITNSSATTKARQAAYWSQIASYFKDYDEHLLFAGANEPAVNDPWGASGQWAFDNSRMQILKGYYEAFITSVRSAGGNNDTRTLIVQAPRTEMDNAPMLSQNWPTDPAGDGYMMAEVHYYPYQYSLMTADEDWGKQFYYYTGLHSTTDTEHNMGWNVYSNSIDNSALGTPNQIKKAFGELKTMFCDKGIPVIIGELGAIKRTGQITDAANLKLHLQGRALFYGEVAKNAKANGIVPYVWDTGAEDDGNMTIITRQKGTNEILDPDVLNALQKAYGQEGNNQSNLDSLVNENEVPETEAGKGVQMTYTSKTADSSEVGTLRINLSGSAKDLSKYVGLEIRMKGEVETAGPCTGASDGCGEYGWTSMDLFMMTGDDWAWFDASVLEQADKGLDASAFDTFQIKWEDFRTEPTNLKSANAIGLNLYGTQVSGTITIDYIKGIKADGSTEIIDDFDKKPSTEGTASAKIVALNGTDAIKTATVAAASKMFVNVQPGVVSANFTAAKTAPAKATLMNSLGQVIAQQNFTANKGMNTVELSSNYRGPAMLMVRQGSQRYMQKVILK